MFSFPVNDVIFLHFLTEDLLLFTYLFSVDSRQHAELLLRFDKQHAKKERGEENAD